jgi:hypothetical protein
MHSKVVLAEGQEHCHLWVGSHNFTARAINGANFEAALVSTAAATAPTIVDAISHLEMCRDTAEPFDPADMDRYREIQRQRWNPDWDVERNVLVIHAETADYPTESEFVVRVQIEPIELDPLIRNDRAVRLFLHEPGKLTPGQAVDYSKAALWHGEITAVVRTERHPRHRGAQGEFPRANYDIDVPDLQTRPLLVAGGTSAVAARTQAVIRLDRRGSGDDEMYSVGNKSPAEFDLASDAELELQPVDRDMRRFFTSESVRDEHLIYRPVEDVREKLIVRGYDETVRSMMDPKEKLAASQHALFANEAGEWSDRRRKRPRAAPEVEYRVVQPKRPIDPYFFLSGYTIHGK